MLQAPPVGVWPGSVQQGPHDPCECWPPGVAAVGASLQGEAQAPRASRSLGPCLGDPQRVLKSLSQRHRGGRACVLPSLLLNCAAVCALRAGVRGHSTLVHVGTSERKCMNTKYVLKVVETNSLLSVSAN